MTQSKTEILTKLIPKIDKKIRIIWNKYNKSYHLERDEFTQHIYLILLEFPDEKFVNLYTQGEKNLLSYIDKLIIKQLNSTTSTYYNNYKTTTVPLLEHNQPADKPDIHLNTDELYRQMIALLKCIGDYYPYTFFTEYFFKKKTYQQISDEYKVNLSTVMYQTNKAKKWLSKQLFTQDNLETLFDNTNRKYIKKYDHID
ncbi:MAG: sigma-70 family RNA polymerase sigma factor, partial [Flavobacterium sp.]